LRIAVIGGGLFGCTAAIHAARAGHDVELYEIKSALMSGATAATYSRLHRGFHYARSPQTGLESRLAERSFRAEYGAAVIDRGQQFYVVADGGHVTVDEYRDFLDNAGLHFSEEDGVFEVTEPRVNLQALQVLVRQKVAEAGVTVHLGQSFPVGETFDKIVVATYSGLNDALGGLGDEPREYKFQVVERPVVLLPEAMRDKSVVVIDGPFGCVDPLDETPLHVLGHVQHTVHAENTGCTPDIPEHLAPLIDKGIIRNGRVTNVLPVINSLVHHVPLLSEAVYIGSSFVVRAVLAHVEATDERPTLVTRVDDQVISVFSGKLGTAVRAAQDVLGLLEERDVSRHRPSIEDHRGTATARA
jgi:hypothetical protein